VKEPLEILQYPSEFSLFPGETVEFNVTLQNHATINYLVILDFQLSDIAYQRNYVKFSDETYNVMPGKNLLTAWASIEPCAQPAETDLIITLKRICPSIVDGCVGRARAHSPKSPSIC